MNKFIKTDLEIARTYTKIAIMNALNDIDSGEEEKINFGSYLSWKLFYECLIESNWSVEDLDQWWDDTNGWEVDFWCPVTSPSGKHCTISGSLWGQDYEIRVEKDE